MINQTIRRLARAPMFTVVTLMTIAIAIGANAAVFSVIEGVLLKPLLYPNSEELVSIWQKAPGHVQELELSPADYFTFGEENRTFKEFGLWSNDSVSVTGLGEPEQVRSTSVTYGTLPTLGI